MEETVTLYVGLKEGEKADFEVVGLAAAAFAEAVKEISYILDPSLDIRIEFDSGTEGSLKLKAIVKTFRSKEGRRAALVTLVSTVGMMLVADLRGYGTGKLLDKFLDTEQRQQLSEDDIQRIAKAIVDIKEGRVAKEPVRIQCRDLNSLAGLA